MVQERRNQQAVKGQDRFYGPRTKAGLSRAGNGMQRSPSPEPMLSVDPMDNGMELLLRELAEINSTWSTQRNPLYGQAIRSRLSL
jgi:hypothetical protein